MIYEEITWNKWKSFLIIFFFIIFIIGLGLLFTYLFDFGIVGLVMVIMLSIGMSLIGYYTGDKVILATTGARQITKKEYPFYYHTVEGLSIAAGLPMPKAYVINDPAINAFATGRDPAHASIAVTKGALDKLNRAELEGVIGHEMSHIKNFDIRLMTVVGVLVGIAIMLSDFILRWMWFGNSNRKDLGTAGVILMAFGIVLAILSPLIAQLIRMAVSRRREYLADASGAMLTKYPKGLADALKKIGKDHDQLKTANNATAHLFIANPFKRKSWLVGLFSTHPPLDDRIKRLEAM